jgi:hypothetical protein
MRACSRSWLRLVVGLRWCDPSSSIQVLPILLTSEYMHSVIKGDVSFLGSSGAMPTGKSEGAVK